MLPTNGWLILNKPLGISSAKAVAIVKRLYKAKKVGHAGTLDPLASGVLPIALGEATKTIAFSMDAAKEYRFTVRWGQATSTDDAEGEITATSDKRPSLLEIQSILPQFTGVITQTPPVYSAIKIKGKRACDRARDGEEVEMKARQVEIHRLQCLESSEDQAEFLAACSKGTYIRSLGRDIALALGTHGHITELIRTKVGKFCITRAISLDNLEEVVYKEAASGLLPVEEALDDIPVLSLLPEQARALRHGQKVTIPPVSAEPGMVFAAKTGGTLVALATIEGDCIISSRVFNL